MPKLTSAPNPKKNKKKQLAPKNVRRQRPKIKKINQAKSLLKKMIQERKNTGTEEESFGFLKEKNLSFLLLFSFYSFLWQKGGGEQTGRKCCFLVAESRCHGKLGSAGGVYGAVLAVAEAKE